MSQEEPPNEGRITEAYDQILANLKDILDNTSRLTRAEFDRALKMAGTSLDEASSFTREEITRAQEAIRKDWQLLVKAANKGKDDLLKSEEFQRIADTTLGALGRLTKSIKDWAGFLDEKIEKQITYSTGEVAGPGTFECTECGKTLRFEKSGRIPPCSGCKNTHFRRKI